MKPKILVIAGPTGSGKTDLAIRLAKELKGEIICADSLTVYRSFNIGTAKPTVAQRQGIPHHLLDISEPTDSFTASDFRTAAANAINDIVLRGKRPIIAGGAGLYLRTLLRGLIEAPGENPGLRNELKIRLEKEGAESLLIELGRVDPETADRLHINNTKRIIRALEVYYSSGIPLSQMQSRHQFSETPYTSLQFCLDMPRQLLYERINKRTEMMIAEGLVDEVESLLQRGLPADSKPLQAIGYKEVTAYLSGLIDHDKMINLIKQNTRNFAKRQLTWFRKEPDMHWVAYPENSANINSAAAKFFE